MTARRTGLLLLALALAAGCANLGYYARSLHGELRILSRRQPIPELIADPATPAPLRRRLETVLAIREFASRDLGLPQDPSFRSYVELDRPYVAWNVFAAPAYSTRPRRWCFPFLGCIGYRGYFARAQALAYAARLAARGDDVYVGGVAAYSTLGWFHDPLPSTVIDWRGPDLAGLIFHELAHALVYVKGDTAFNESFAMLVEQEGVRRWLRERGEDAAWARYRERCARQEIVVGLILRYRRRLDALYRSGLDPEAMGAAKARLFRYLRAEYAAWRAAWGEDPGYDAWFAGPLNNAALAAVVTYHEYLPAFRALLDRHHGDLPAFYAEVRVLARLPAGEREAALARPRSRHPGRVPCRDAQMPRERRDARSGRH